MKNNLKNINTFHVNQQETYNDLLKWDSFCYFIAGFIEGQGSLWASINYQPKLKWAIKINIGFSITQHSNGKPLLESMQKYFNAGRIYQKYGSSNVWVYEINDIKNLQEKIIPFFENYIMDFSYKFKHGTYENMKLILQALLDKKHQSLDGLIYIVNCIFKMNPAGKGKKRKRGLDEIISLIKTSRGALSIKKKNR